MPTLLFLCHANIARSPAAEALARAHFDSDSGWNVRSSGTHARSGYPIDSHIGAALRRRGLGSAHHRSSPPTISMLDEARLILTFESGQRSWVLREVPGAVRRTFTIRRAAAVIADRGIAGLGADTAAYTTADDFADPHGLGALAAENAVVEIEGLLAQILPALESSGLEPDPLTALRARAAGFDRLTDNLP